ncbi:FAD-dependent oxidoreductase [Ruminococcus callidus]|uniref:FAD-dependent oxidoreductase n=1 Tax=Ruminococcus callidus TaxID=40519 RepID=UPI0023F9BF17|nr:FAD-dependent oxidoreductase [Ruminococcus callidus]
MYTEEMLESIKKVEAKRAENAAMEPKRMTAEEKDQVLKENHPDYREDQFDVLTVGPNKGEKAPKELVKMLQSDSRLKDNLPDLSCPDYETDVLIIGGGGAGASAAIEADNAGEKVMIVTKLRIGDANTMMAEGGIQAADKPNDSPAQHFLDCYGGGHFAADKELVYKLVTEAPEGIEWLQDLGVEFDKDAEGNMITTHGGGTSRKRMHAAKDYSGAEIMRTLRDEVLNRKIPVVDFTSAIELIMDDKGHCAGAVLMNMETGEILIAKAKVVIIATGGAGRMHYQGFPTSNHYGATADGLVLAYRVGAPLREQYTLQYHPTGAAFPEQIFGALVTEKVRSLGAKLVNVDGEVFMNPLETRDVTASTVIRECRRGKQVDTTGGQGVWLDAPMIDIIHGEGTIEKRIPAMLRMFLKYGIDIRKQPMLIYPTLHYQNGGVKVGTDSQTCVENLFVAGEAAGGVHGENRLMGNSLLDVIVFGRNAGKYAAAKAKTVEVGKLTLDHVAKFEKELADAGIQPDEVSPKLLPDYTRKVND